MKPLESKKKTINGEKRTRHLADGSTETYAVYDYFEPLESKED